MSCWAAAEGVPGRAAGLRPVAPAAGPRQALPVAEVQAVPARVRRHASADALHPEPELAVLGQGGVRGEPWRVYWSGATVGLVGRGRKKVTPDLQAVFAAALGIPAGGLAALGGMSVPEGDEVPLNPAADDVAERMREARRLTVDQVKLVRVRPRPCGGTDHAMQPGFRTRRGGRASCYPDIRLPSAVPAGARRHDFRGQPGLDVVGVARDPDLG